MESGIMDELTMLLLLTTSISINHIKVGFKYQIDT